MPAEPVSDENDDDLDEELPAWSLEAAAVPPLEPVEWAERVDRQWAWGGSTGAGVRVCIVDSGVDPDHPLVGRVDSAVAIVADGEQTSVVEDDEGDLCGHGTACAGIVRALAPHCE